MPQQVVLVLGITKRGLEQKVALDHPTVVCWLRGYRAHVGRFALSCRVCPSSYHAFTRWFYRAAAALGFGATTWTSHGLRRGGATELLRRGYPLSTIMLHGRWLG